MIRVECQPAVIFVVRDTVVVIIMVTDITFSVFVVVSLIGVRNVRAVVQVILVPILVNVLVAVALVSHAVRIRVELLERKKARFLRLLFCN